MQPSQMGFAPMGSTIAASPSDSVGRSEENNGQMSSQTTGATSSPQTNPIFSTTPPVTTEVQGGSASRFPLGWDPATGLGMPPEFFIPSSMAQFSASATQSMSPRPSTSATQPAAQNAWMSQMAAQLNASVPPLMTPQQHLALLLQPKTPIETLIARSPHQGGVNWVFHDSMIGALRHVNVPYMDPTDSSASS